MNLKSFNLFHVVTVLCLLVFAYSSHGEAAKKDGLLHVYLLDVGQGDAIFVETPSGNQILIDGGPDGKVIQELGEVMPFHDRSIDVVVLTHGDADHVSGLVEVLERYDVGMIVKTNGEKDTGVFKSFKESAAKENAKIVEAVDGRVLDLGNGIVFKIIFPDESMAGKKVSDVNNYSIVAMLDYGQFEMLLTGDIEEKTERKILGLGESVDADILKLAHHGSKTSSMQEFLDAVSPEVGLISVGGDNRYGHPSPIIIERLEKSSIPYYRTDTNGRIEVRSDGEHFSVITEK